MISELISTPKTYIDFEKLADELMAGFDPTKLSSLSDFIKVDNLVTDI